MAPRPGRARLPRRRGAPHVRRLSRPAPAAPPGILTSPPRLGLLLIAVAAATWGTTGATLKLVGRDSPMSPLLVGFVRVAIAAPCLWLAARGVTAAGAAATAGDRWRLVAAGLAMAGYQVGYFYGVAKTSVAVGALIAICSAPILMVGLAAALLGEPVTVTTAVALGLGVTGAALLAAGPPGAGALPAGFGVGMGLALGAGLCYALYAVLVRDVVARVPALPVAAVTFTVAAVALAPALALELPAGGPWTWAWLAYLGIVPTALAYVLYVQGLRTTPVGVSGVLSLVEPLTATMLGVVFFGDRLGVTGGVGAVLLLVAVGLLAVRQGRAGPGSTG